MVRIDANGRIDPNGRPGLGAAQPVLRKTSAIVMIAALYTSLADTGGFSPLGDGVSGVSGAFFIDRIVAPIILLGAFIAQWQVAAHKNASPIVLPVVTAETGVYYQKSDYWGFFMAEAALLYAAWWFKNQGFGAIILAAVLGALWLLGWQITPYHRKREIWEIVKGFLILELFYEARRLVRR